MTRKEWNDVASILNADFVNIEVICSDKMEYRNRVENRKVGVENLKLPTWEEVINREYHKWNEPRILIDTSRQTIDQSFNLLKQELSKIKDHLFK